MAKLGGDIYKIEPKLSYGRRFLSFLFLTLAAFLVIYSFLFPLSSQFDPETYHPIAGLLVAVFPLVAGITVGTKRSVYVECSKNLITINKSVASIIYSKSFLKYQALEYVSIFRNYADHFESRLFYDQNNYVPLFEIKREKEAISRVYRICDALSISINNLIIDDYWEDKKAPQIADSKREISVFLSEGKRPIWQNAIASFCFTLSILSLYYFITLLVRNDYEFKKGTESFIELAVFLGGTGVGFSLVKDYMFDVKNKHYKIIYRIGPIAYGTWRILRKLEYISVHQKRLGEFHVNLWYNKTKRFELGAYGSHEPALALAKQLAIKFKLAVLDSSPTAGKRWFSSESLINDPKCF